ncbi:MAG TPA: AMP-binding protein [Candidatus Acidoferrales bacterium]|nr:AMP-binding protein [Candidatus Acidoferrales bacterium]
MAEEVISGEVGPRSSVSEFLSARDYLLAHRTDYHAALRGFSWPKMDRFNWALDYFDVMAADNSRLALLIVEEDGTQIARTFAELSGRSNQAANFLRALGVRRGDHILVMLGNQAALWEVLLAGMKLGAVLIPAAPLLATEDLRDRLDRGNVRHVIAAASQAAKFDPLTGSYSRITAGGAAGGWQSLEDAAGHSASFAPGSATSADDPFLLYFTSGTTAKPKLVRHSHQSYPVGHLSTMYWIGLQPGDLHWNISSPGWAKHAWSCVFAPWNAGATVFAYNQSRFNPRAALQALVQFGVTTLCAPPTVWRMLVQEPLGDYPVPLREVVSAGEPLNPEVIERVRAAWGLTIRDGYGQTETTAMIGNPPGEPVKPGSMGRTLPGYQVVLLDSQGNPSSEGEICLDLSPRPLGLMQGYVQDGVARTDPADHAYYHTGDVAARDADGYITCIGRKDDVFKASDYRLSPFELESALIEHPAIAEAAVVPSPDPLRLAVPKAFLILRNGYQPSQDLARELFTFIRARLAPYKRVRRLEFSDLPKTISGKIRRAELRIIERDRNPMEKRPHEFFEEDFE